MDDPARFPALLREVAGRPDPAALATTALVASTAATTEAEAAGAWFFYAVAQAIEGSADDAAGMVAEARRLDPDQAGGWIAQLADLGRSHPAVLPLIAVLTAPDAGPGGGPTDGQATVR